MAKSEETIKAEVREALALVTAGEIERALDVSGQFFYVIGFGADRGKISLIRVPGATCVSGADLMAERVRECETPKKNTGE